jgi:hypothetical protein
MVEKKAATKVQAKASGTIKPLKPRIATQAETPAKPATRTVAAKPRVAQAAARPAESAPPVTKTVAKAAAKPAAKVASKPAPKPAVAKPEKTPKAKKPRLVRDSFTMPEAEYERISELKKRLALVGDAVKKSELLRAGIALLAALNDSDLKAALAKVERIKTGRPGKK